MTTINDISDLVQVLRNHPEWRYTVRGLVIDEDLAQIPQRMSELEKILSAYIEENEKRSREQDALLAAYVEETKRRIEDTDRRINELHQHLDEYRRFTQKNVEQSSQRMNRIDGRLDNGLGINYEVKVEKNLHSIVGQGLRIRRVRILRSFLIDFEDELMGQIEDAEEGGRITGEQASRLLDTDLIFSGIKRGESERTYFVAEASITIAESDIVRAANSAGILSVVLGHPTEAAVIGANISDSLYEIYASNNVEAIRYPDW